jgi:RNA polymerase sigma factor (sigma-70 family)
MLGTPVLVPCGPQETAVPGGDKPADVPYAEFALVYQREMPRLIGFLMRCGSEIDIAEEAAQHAFMELWMHWETVRHPEGWVRKVALRLAIRTFNRVANEDPLGPDCARATGPPAWENIEIREQQRAVLAALHQLPLTQRQVFALHYDQFGTREISEILEMTESSVRKNLERGRRRLRDSLKSSVADQSSWQAA